METSVFTIISAILGFLGFIISIVALFINWKKFTNDKPNLKASVIKSSYSRDVSREKERLNFKLLIQFINRGQAPGSIIDLKAYLRYPEKLYEQYPYLKYQFPKSLHFVTPANIATDCPFTIQANGAENKEFEFIFNDLKFEYLDRCDVPIDFANPKNWERNDLPILMRLVADTSSGEIEFYNCSFRVDQEESEIHFGSLDYNFKYGGPKDDFSPKIDFWE